MSCGVTPGELSAWTALASALISVVTLIFVIKATVQVRIAAEQLRQSAQGSLLAIEESLNDARHRWMTARFSKVEQQRYFKNSKTKIAAIRYDRARDEEAEAYQQFLNRLDRLCAAVDDGLIAEARAKADYFGMIETIVHDDPALHRLSDSRHENITRLYLKWRDPEPDDKP